ncbi:hypothetical protein MYK68_03445 [Gordonia sp. PP30]|uniref:hypothetical protein n=1 Tax=Gordonia sp. PP30 TaxID=2935861 RepID=UPI001FFF81FE|nr:hypothetical protein [Gordonia sp. PP30]UQE75688.1 hypothetical protein MYK68_03445 [Gordonia sp. PP30]
MCGEDAVGRPHRSEHGALEHGVGAAPQVAGATLDQFGTERLAVGLASGAGDAVRGDQEVGRPAQNLDVRGRCHHHVDAGLSCLIGHRGEHRRAGDRHAAVEAGDAHGAVRQAELRGRNPGGTRTHALGGLRIHRVDGGEGGAGQPDAEAEGVRGIAALVEGDRPLGVTLGDEASGEETRGPTADDDDRLGHDRDRRHV